MQEPYVKTTIKKDGTILIEVVGAVGPECLAMTEAAEKALGVVIDRELKPEFDAVPQQEAVLQPQTA